VTKVAKKAKAAANAAAKVNVPPMQAAIEDPVVTIEATADPAAMARAVVEIVAKVAGPASAAADVPLTDQSISS
jgi:hypothetical protein